VGRHSTPEEPPPPKDKPRYRFVLAISAIFLLAFASMAVVAAVFPDKAPQAEASPGDPGAAGNPFPSISSGSPGPVAPAAPQSSTTATGPFTGRFEVSQDWSDGFIGAVQLSNGTAGDKAWQVQLVFPANVGALQSRWISGGPGDSTVARTGQTVTFTGSVPLAAGAHIGIYFQFAKATGSPVPSACSVNGGPCTP
jgi:hypothetical protein